MHNNYEHGILESAGNQRTSGHSDFKSDAEDNKMGEYLCEMVIPTNKDGPEVHGGCSINNLLSVESGEIHPEFSMNVEGEGYEYVVEDKLRRNPEALIDDITFSEDENENVDVKHQPLTNETMTNELKTICDLYEEDATVNKYTGTRNEIEERKEIPVPFEIGANDNLLEAGVVDDITDGIVIVKANTMHNTIDLDNILFNVNKIPIGYIDDVIGKVEEPCYVIKLFPNIDKTLLNLTHGQSIYFPENKTKYVVKTEIYRKGCDASNAFDEELIDDEMECSDDEQEFARKAEKKKTKNNKKRKVEDTIDDPAYEYIKQSANKLKEKYSNTNYNPNNTMLNTGLPSYNNPYYSTEYKINPMNQINQMNYNPMMFNPYMVNNMSYFNPVNPQLNINFQSVNPFQPPNNNK